MAKAFIRAEYPSCVHVAVCGATSERSAVMLARNLASRHFGLAVGHYVSSGGSSSPETGLTWTYVFSNPGCGHQCGDEAGQGASPTGSSSAA
jgi:hypothetical protein